MNHTASASMQWPTYRGWLGHHVVELAECGSTNDEAARLARAGAAHGTVVVADVQTHGRGRLGRTWVSLPGQQLLMSVILRPPLALAQTPGLALSTAIAVCDSVRKCGAKATLKWPNDILVDGKKCSGILVEAQSQGNRLESLVIGIGLNLQGELGDLADIATTLAAAGASHFMRSEVLANLLLELEHWTDRYVGCGMGSIINEWNQRMQPGLRVRFTNRSGAQRLGVATGIGDDGSLCIDCDGELEHIVAGDVEIVRTLATSHNSLQTPHLVS